MVPFYQHARYVRGFCVSRGLEFLAVGRLQVRSHVVGAESQADFEILVAEYLFLFTKDGVRELRIESRDGLQAGRRRRNKGHLERIIGVRQPC